MTAALLALAFATSGLETQVEATSFGPWPDAVRLSNGLVELTVVPSVGRIVQFGFIGERNVLWLAAPGAGLNAGWANHGGDKIWTSPQSAWGWPPEAAHDGLPHDLTLVGDHVILTSGLSPTTGVQIRRTIRLVPGRAEAVMTNELINRGAWTLHTAPWQVTQVDDPPTVVMPIYPSPQQPKGWYDYESNLNDLHERIGDTLHLRRDGKTFRKYGAGHPSNQLEARWPDVIFRMSAPFVPGGDYPDSGSAQQVYLSGSDTYIELELTGPLEPLAPGAKLTLEVTWRLER